MESIFDRVMKDKLQTATQEFACSQLGISPISVTPENTELPRTMGRRIDYLSIIESIREGKLLLHMEYQTTNDPKLHYRMLEYKGILLRKYELPVVQYVLYLGEEPMNMPNEYTDSQWQCHYELQDIRSISAHSLLKSPKPAAVAMALLADYEGEPAEEVISKILKKLQLMVKSPSDFHEYMTRLGVMSKLRNLEETLETQKSMLDITFKPEDFPEYYKLFEKGYNRFRNEVIDDRNREFALKLINDGGLSFEKIASVTDLSLEVVKQLAKGN